MSLMLEKGVPRYGSLTGAAKQTQDTDEASVEVFVHLLRTVDLIRTAEDKYLSQYNLSQGRFVVLTLLQRSDIALRSSDLAEQAGVSRATMTGLLDALERDQLVRREGDPSDRRVTKVALIEGGRALLDRIMPGYFEFVTRIASILTPAERSQLTSLAQKLGSALEAPRAGVEAEPVPADRPAAV